MNATELFLKDGKDAGIFFCEKCRQVAASQYLADRCCKEYLCSKCGNATGGRIWLVCDACRAADESAKERERFEKAEKLTAWDGWVYLEGTGREGYSESLSDFYDNWGDNHDEGGEPPKYVWACQPRKIVKAHLDDILEPMMDDAYEDFDPETLNGLDELQAALDKFNAANKGAISYEIDYSKAVLLNSDYPTAG